MRALTNPFNSPAPKLGFGTFVPTGKLPLWTEQQTVASGTAVGCVVMLDCSATSMVTYWNFTGAQVNSTLGAIAGAVTVNSSNTVLINSSAQTARLINLGMRCKVRASTNSQPGIAGFVCVPQEGLTNVLLMTPNTILALPGYKSCSSTAVGMIGGEVQILPADNHDFEFLTSTISGYSTGVSRNIALFVAYGWTVATWNMEINVFGHIETLGGLDAAGETDAEPDLVDGGESIDSVSTLLSRNPSAAITTSLEAMTLLDEATSIYRTTRDREANRLSTFLRGLTSTGSLLAGSISNSTAPQSEDITLPMPTDYIDGQRPPSGPVVGESASWLRIRR